MLCKLDHPEFTLYNLTGLKMIVDTWNASQKVKERKRDAMGWGRGVGSMLTRYVYAYIA